MMSEEIKFKESEIKINPKPFKIIKKDDNDSTTFHDKEINEKNTQIINIKLITTISDSIINYFAIGICFVLIGFYDLEWFKIKENENKFYFGYFLIAGICLYIIGIFNWYEGKEPIFLIDFVLSFYFMTIFLKNQDLEYFNKHLPKENIDKIQGTFYILLSCFILIIGVSSKEKGVLFIIDYVILFVAFIFMFIHKFFPNGMLLNIYSFYFIILCGAFFWITGILKLINSLLNRHWKLMDPSD